LKWGGSKLYILASAAIVREVTSVYCKSLSNTHYHFHTAVD